MLQHRDGSLASYYLKLRLAEADCWLAEAVVTFPAGLTFSQREYNL